MNKILVTGATGFIGSHIVEALAACGFSVRALVRNSSRRAFTSQPELVFGDVTDPVSLKPAVDGVQGVVHCAGLTRARSLEHYRSVNRDGTANLMMACCTASPRPSRIVVLSSLAAFGPSNAGKPIREDDQPNPISDYGRSKLEGHRAAESYRMELPVSILIPPAVYGPRDKDIYVYFKLARKGIVPFLGRRKRFFSVVYVKDLARAAVECLRREEAAGASYLLEDGAAHTWQSFAGEIGNASGRKLTSLVIPRLLAWGLAAMAEGASKLTRRPPLLGIQKMRELLQPSWVCTGERIRRELGWQIQYPLEKGIVETYHWYVTNGWL